MSDKEKELVKRISALPAELQGKFLDQARGAEMALDMLQGETREAKDEKED